MFYQNIIKHLTDHKPYVIVNCIQIDLSSVIGTIIEHAKEWKLILGECIVESTNNKIKTIEILIGVSYMICLRFSITELRLLWYRVRRVTKVQFDFEQLYCKNQTKYINK